MPNSTLSLLLIPILAIFSAEIAFAKKNHINLGKYFDVISAIQKVEAQQEYDYQLEKKGKFSSIQIGFFNRAIASTSDQTCLIGGVQRSLVNGLCPTFGRSCSKKEDSFKCGEIYNETCVSRTPIKTLSKRCAATATLNVPETIDETEKFVKKAKNIYENNCLDAASRSKSGCMEFQKSLAQIEKKDLGDTRFEECIYGLEFVFEQNGFSQLVEQNSHFGPSAKVTFTKNGCESTPIDGKHPYASFIENEIPRIVAEWKKQGSEFKDILNGSKKVLAFCENVPGDVGEAARTTLAAVTLKKASPRRRAKRGQNIK